MGSFNVKAFLIVWGIAALGCAALALVAFAGRTFGVGGVVVSYVLVCSVVCGFAFRGHR